VKRSIVSSQRNIMERKNLNRVKNREVMWEKEPGGVFMPQKKRGGRQ